MDLTHLSVGNAAVIALMGYLVVFIGLILLMIVIVIMGRIMMNKSGKKADAKAPAAPVKAIPAAAPTAAPAAAEVMKDTDNGASEVTRAAENAPAPAAQQFIFPGSAGQLALYDTDPREAAMVMAVLADTLGKPLSELRFISIKEVK